MHQIHMYVWQYGICFKGVHVCVDVNADILICMCMHKYMYVHAFLRMGYAHLRTCICICDCVWVYMSACGYKLVYVCLWVSAPVCVNACV